MGYAYDSKRGVYIHESLINDDGSYDPEILLDEAGKSKKKKKKDTDKKSSKKSKKLNDDMEPDTDDDTNTDDSDDDSDSKNESAFFNFNFK